MIDIEVLLILSYLYIFEIFLTVTIFFCYALSVGGVRYPRDYIVTATFTGIFLPIVLPYAVARYIQGKAVFERMGENDG